MSRITLLAKPVGDAALVKYLLEKPCPIQWLQESTQAICQKLESDDLQSQRGLLVELWPAILTDALMSLKRLDKRESTPNFRSFFHRDSLGIQDLTRIINAFDKFESLSYGASPSKYRDHLSHVFRVWMMGHQLLVSRLRGLFADDFRVKSVEWQNMWALVALCHDLGYPIRTIQDVNAASREAFKAFGQYAITELRLDSTPQMLLFNDTVVRLLSSKPVKCPGGRKYLTHLQNKYYLKFLKSFDNLDHGILSSLLISRSLVYFLESDFCQDHNKPLIGEDARQFWIRREILRAIASHTCLDIYHLRFDTLSFLLYILDESQDWGRPTLEEELYRSSESSVADTKTAIIEYTRQRIHMSVEVPSLDKARERILKQISRIHRIMRLAVDTPTIPQALFLKYEFRDSTGKTAWFRLSRRRIEKHPKEWFPDG